MVLLYCEGCKADITEPYHDAEPEKQFRCPHCRSTKFTHLSPWEKAIKFNDRRFLRAGGISPE